MSEIVTAVYEKGVLRPLQPMNLREYQKVRLEVLPEEAPVQTEPEPKIIQVIQNLVASGLMRPKPGRISLPPDPVSEAERLSLADKLGKAPGKPLSEIIIEERGEL